MLAVKRLYPMLAIAVAVGLCLIGSTQTETPQTGPLTEKRFPPLQLSAEFRATLFACDPLIEYPSVIARGPKLGTLFVAIDYMTGLGRKIVRRDEIRLIKDSDNDGYADSSVVFAKGFNSIQGMEHHDGTVFVMHAPLLTALCDTDGDGKADERRDLLTGLGLLPEKNPSRLHCANGVTLGYDNWLYLSLGDNGCRVQRPEGDTLVLEGGGILRCRPDGRDLHVFATGLRNIYDVALDAELNVFTRDNENDGGQYMIRVCHSFFGADHGYPYLYYERPDEALPPLADLGRGSSAGGTMYLETSFPPAYRGNLFFCEWGSSVVRYQPRRLKSGFGLVKETTFASASPNDNYGFKPTDVVVDYDGSLLVSDWADGQRPKRGRGRIYRIAAKKPAAHAKPSSTGDALSDLITDLDSPSFLIRHQAQSRLQRRGRSIIKALNAALAGNKLGSRGRRHVVWILAHTLGDKSLPELFAFARTDRDVGVRIQAIHAIADLTDPVLVKHQLNATAAAPQTALKIAALGESRDLRVQREVIVALGRLGWRNAPMWMHENIKELDPALAHAAMQTMRRSRNWPDVLKLTDLPDDAPLRKVALRSLARQYAGDIVDGLVERLRKERRSTRQQEYVDLLARIYKQPAAWKYWGYRPPPRPANSVVWAKTDDIGAALDHVLNHSDFATRHIVLQSMQREKIPAKIETLLLWLKADHNATHSAAVLESLSNSSSNEVRPLLEFIIRERKHAAKCRVTALQLLLKQKQVNQSELILHLAKELEDGPVMAEVLRQSSRRPAKKMQGLLQTKLSSSHADVRAAAIEALSALRVTNAAKPIRQCLDDANADVRRAAILAMGELRVNAAGPQLLTMARENDAALKSACLVSLRLLREPRAVPIAVKALEQTESQLSAIEYLAEFGGPQQAKPLIQLASQTTSIQIIDPVIRILDKWREQNPSRRAELENLIARVQGAHGSLLRWHSATSRQRTIFATGTEGRITIKPKNKTKPATMRAQSDFFLPERAQVQFLTSSNGNLRIRLDDKEVFSRKKPGAFLPDSDRFKLTLNKGRHHVEVEVTPSKNVAQFHLRFRRVSSKAEHEKLIRATLATRGNALRGRDVFFNVKKSQCLKCHRLGVKGERIGPDLSGLGKRFSRVHIVESILEPSRSIAPSYGTVLIELKDGRILSGAKVNETQNQLTIGDNEGKKHTIPLELIAQRITTSTSTMPEGLERSLSEREFVDLIAFLAGQK